MAHGVQAATLVWHEGMTEWAPAASLAELAVFFQPVPPPLPTRTASAGTPPTIEQVRAGTPTSVLPSSGQPTSQSPAQEQVFGRVTGNQPFASPASARPQFSVEVSKRKWWHYLLYAVAVFVMMLLFRGCGVLLGEAVTATRLTPYEPSEERLHSPNSGIPSSRVLQT